MDWVVTVPKSTDWDTYKQELAAVADFSQVMNYRSAYIPKDMKVGDRCYIVWNGKVRGWMLITGLEDRTEAWRCTTTGTIWAPGKYIQRSGPFHAVKGRDMKGFRGIRKYEAS